MTVLWPRQCMAMKSSSVSAATWRMFGSASPPETSLMIAAPASAQASAVCEFMVSTLTRMPRCTSSRTTGRTRFCSTSDGMRSAPGLVVSPPTSIMSAPAETILTAWAMAPSTWANSPPSLKESGVTLSTPMIWGRMPRAPVSGMLATPADQGHRLRALHRVGKSAAGGDSNRRAAHLLHAARGDTAVYGVGDHEHTPRGESVGEGVRDLFGQPLLELRSGS